VVQSDGYLPLKKAIVVSSIQGLRNGGVEQALWLLPRKEDIEIGRATNFSIEGLRLIELIGTMVLLTRAFEVPFELLF
jgi:hypothetical protein